jgi:hypothetical protein
MTASDRNSPDFFGDPSSATSLPAAKRRMVYTSFEAFSTIPASLFRTPFIVEARRLLKEIVDSA